MTKALELAQLAQAVTYSEGSNTISFGNNTIVNLYANGSFGSSGQVLTSNGSGTYWSTVTGGGGGGASYEVGQLIMAANTPSTGTWLETGKYYSKSAYPALANTIGDIADFGDFPDRVQNDLKPRFSAPAFGNYLPKCTADDGSTAVVVGTSGFIATSNNGSDWRTVTSRVSGSFAGIKRLNSTFIAYGANITTSTDGLTWTQRANPGASSQVIADIAYGNSKYVVATFGQGLHYTTDLDTQWTKVNQTYAANAATYTNSALFHAVEYQNSIFVAVGQSGLLMTSTDGVTWTERASALASTASNIRDVVYLNNTFFIFNGAGNISYSSDGTTWTAATITQSNQNHTSMAYNGSVYVIVGSASIWSSADGATWTARLTSANGLTSQFFKHVIWTGSKFVAVADEGWWATSTDGVSWTVRRDVSFGDFVRVHVFNGITVAFAATQSPGTQGAAVILEGATRAEVLQSGQWRYGGSWSTNVTNPRMVAFNSNTYVTCANGGKVLYSTNGDTWQASENLFPSTGNFYASVVANNTFFVMGGAGNDGTGRLWYSANGSSYTNASPGLSFSAVNSIAFGNNVFAIAGSRSGGGIAYSTDLVTWTAASGQTQYNDIIYEGGKFVAAGTGIITSPDGTTWTSQGLTSISFNRLRYLNSTYFACGNSNSLYRSTDGTSFTNVGTSAWSAPSAVTTYDIAWNGTVYCVVGSSGFIATSTTGLAGSWTVRSPGMGVNFYNITWDGSKFLITINDNAMYLTSPDGINWTPRSHGLSSIFHGYLNNKYIAIGSGVGQVASSSDGLTWQYAQNVQYVPTNVYKALSLGNTHFLCTDVGLFTSNNLINFTPVRTVGPGVNCTGVAYGNNKWLALHPVSTGYICSGSTDGSSWSKYSDFFIAWTIGGGISTNSSDIAYANSNFVISTAQQPGGFSTPSFIMYSNDDGATWKPSKFPWMSYGSTGMLASNGSVLMAVSHSGGYKSTDGGVTWTQVVVGPGQTGHAAYTGTFWDLSHGYSGYTPDTLRINGGQTILQAGFVSNADGSISSYRSTQNNLYLNPKSNGIANFPKSSKFQGFNVSNANYKPYPIRSSNTAMIPASSATTGTINPVLLQEVPLYRYDTSTTFFVPPAYTAGSSQNVGGGAFNVYIYAGP